MLRKDAKHSRITLSDGRAPATPSSPTDPADPPPAGFFFALIQARKNPAHNRRAEESVLLSLVYIRAGSSTGPSITALTQATKPMGGLTRRGFLTTTRGADETADDRAGHLREQHRGAYRAHRGPAGMTRDAHPHHAARCVPAAGARVLPAPLPRVAIDPEFSIRDRDALGNRAERIQRAVTRGVLGLVRVGWCGHGLALIDEGDNPRVVERAAGGDVFRFCVCAGQMHSRPRSSCQTHNRHTESRRSSFIGHVRPTLEWTRSRTHPVINHEIPRVRAQKTPAPQGNGR